MTIFKGSAVAIVTPFHNDELKTVDYHKLGELVEFQIKNGIDAIVVCGTTGEASTMTDEEQIATVKYVVEKVNKRVPVIAGAGSNNTLHGVELSVACEKAGADAILSVTPYYNKASQQGLILHYEAIADALTIPVVLYNVPSRTGVNLLPQTVKALSEHPNIVAVKEASGNVSQAAEIKRLCGDRIDVYSGNDDLNVPLMTVGSIGVISVLANICPKETTEMVHAYLDGDIAKASEMQIKYNRLISSLFIEPNPIPVKEAMNIMGLPSGALRLPLCEASANTVEQLMQSLTEVELV